MNQIITKQLKATKSQFTQILRLQNQNYLLTQQLEDLRNKYNNLKKQHQIWDNITTSNNISIQSEKKIIISQYEKQVTCLKDQLISIAKQKHSLQFSIKQMTQKIQDLKYTNLQLKQLNEKQSQLHHKQIQLLFSGNNLKNQENCSIYGNSRVFNDTSNRLPIFSNLQSQIQLPIESSAMKILFLQKQLKNFQQLYQKSQQKLQKCSQIAKQMQQYYISQLQSKDQFIQQQQQQIRRLKDDLKMFFQSPKINLKDREESLKFSSQVSEYDPQISSPLDKFSFSQLQQKFSFTIHSMKQSHQQEIIKYQNKIKYLIEKIEVLQNEKMFSNQGQNQVAFQASGLKLSKISHDSSFNFTPNTSLSIFKDDLNSRQKTQVRTPNKLSLKSKTNRKSCYYERIPLNQTHINL